VNIREMARLCKQKREVQVVETKERGPGSVHKRERPGSVNQRERESARLC
jgi:hypothetical protein